jgi:hypothetical protein
MAPYGLKPGKAPPRLRGKEAAKYGEKAAGTVAGAAVVEEDEATDDEAPEPATQTSAQNGAREKNGQHLPIVS